jgi:hypothetical protein
MEELLFGKFKRLPIENIKQIFMMENQNIFWEKYDKGDFKEGRIEIVK